MSKPMAALPGSSASSDAASPPSAPVPAKQMADDDILAAIYVRMWSLATGRRLQPGVKPDQLTVDELVAFWDDISPASGRHAAPEADPAWGAR
jgi:hypothetical protein